MRLFVLILVFLLLDGKHETKHGKPKKVRHAEHHLQGKKQRVAKAPAKMPDKEKKAGSAAEKAIQDIRKATLLSLHESAAHKAKTGLDPRGIQEFHQVIELPNLFGPLLHSPFQMHPPPMLAHSPFHPPFHPHHIPPHMLPSTRFDGKNKVIEHAPHVGAWGGECLCPDGRTYYVGDEMNGCSSIACVGGVKKSCIHRVNPKWSHRKVICGGNPNDREVYQRPHTHTYMGCFMDEEDRDLKVSIGKPYNADECHAKCAILGTPHFSLQDHGHCFCGTHETIQGKYDKLQDSECGECPGPDCLGTVSKNAVYSVASQYVYIGCYVDEIMNRDGDSRPDLTKTMGTNTNLQQCFMRCKNTGAPNFALALSEEGPGKCQCGSHTPGRYERRPDDECGECPGDACVGFRDRNAMYLIVPQYSFEGCFQDKEDKPDLDDATYTNFRHTECYAKCAGQQSKHFSLQGGNKCHCGTHKETDDYKRLPSDYCGRDLRGSPLRNALYTINYRGRLGFEQPSTIRTIVIEHTSHSGFTSLEHGLNLYISWWHIYLGLSFLFLMIGLIIYFRYSNSGRQKRFFRIWGAKEEGKSLLSEKDPMYRGEIKPKTEKADSFHL